MINRPGIKDRAKTMFSMNYWKLVGIALLGFILVFGPSAFVNKYDVTAGGIKVTTNKTVSILSIAYTIFVGNVITVGLCRACLAAYRGEEFDLGDLFAFFNENYLRVVGGMALVTLFVTLGFILLIVPGIIASLGLSRVAYLLADGDTATGIDLIKKSWDMMNGHKSELFVFILSFIGWLLLTAITAGVVGVFYVNPYMNVALAGYHDELTNSTPAAA